MSVGARIGVYVCHCGVNIAAVVDVKQVTEVAAALPGVVVARDYLYMCSDPGQALITRDIAEYGLDRVVVFEVDEEELVQRMLARGRADDTEETIRHRFKVYLDQTQPLLDLYDSRGVTVRINGIGEVDEVTDRILWALQ